MMSLRYCLLHRICKATYDVWNNKCHVFITGLSTVELLQRDLKTVTSGDLNILISAIIGEMQVANAALLSV